MNQFQILNAISNNEKRLLFVVEDKKIEFVNQAFLDFFNVKSLEEFKEKYKFPCKLMKVDNKPLTFSCKDDNFFEYMKNLQNKPIEINNHYFQLEIFKINDNSFVINLTDITSIYKDNKKLDKLANHDQLTGVYNRYKLHELFDIKSKLSNRYEIKLSCIIFDIDNFKMVNDIYGHDIGDEVLKTLTKIVQNSIRETDILARWGGEEFVILLPNTDINQAKIVAEKIRKVVEEYEFNKVKRH